MDNCRWWIAIVIIVVIIVGVKDVHADSPKDEYMAQMMSIDTSLSGSFLCDLFNNGINPCPPPARYVSYIFNETECSCLAQFKEPCWLNITWWCNAPYSWLNDDPDTCGCVMNTTLQQCPQDRIIRDYGHNQFLCLHRSLTFPPIDFNSTNTDVTGFQLTEMGSNFLCDLLDMGINPCPPDNEFAQYDFDVLTCTCNLVLFEPCWSSLSWWCVQPYHWRYANISTCECVTTVRCGRCPDSRILQENDDDTCECLYRSDTVDPMTEIMPTEEYTEYEYYYSHEENEMPTEHKPIKPGNVTQIVCFYDEHRDETTSNLDDMECEVEVECGVSNKFYIVISYKILIYHYNHIPYYVCTNALE